MGLYDDLKFDNGTYVPQYAGAPLEEIKDTATDLATRHYQNIASLTNTGILAHQLESQLLPGAKGYAKEHISAIENELADMAKNGGENSSARVNMLASKLQSDEGLMAGLAKSKDYAEFQKTKNTMIANGLDPLWNKDLEKQYLETPIIDPKTGKVHDLYNKPFGLAPERGLNYMEKQDKVLEPLKADAWETDLSKAWESAQKQGKSSQEFLESTTYKGLSAKKVHDYLFKKVTDTDGRVIDGLGWTTYKSSPEYRQQSQVRGMSDDEIKSELQSRGEAKVFSDISKQFVKNPFTNDKGATTKVNTGQPITLPGAVKHNKPVYNENGTIKTAQGVLTTDMGLGPHAGAFDVPTATGVPRTMESKPLVAIAPEFIKDLKLEAGIQGVNIMDQPSMKKGLAFKGQVDLGSTPNYSNKEPTEKDWEAFARTPEAQKLVTDRNKRIENVVGNAYTHPFPDTKTQNEVENHIRSNWMNYQFMDEEGNIIDPTKDGKITKEFENLIGTTDPNKIVLAGIVDPKHFLNKNGSANFITPYQASATNKDGETKTFFVSNAPGAENTVSNNEHVLYQKMNLRSGDPVDFSANDHKIILQKVEGSQYAQLDPQQRTEGAVIGEIDGQLVHFNSPEEAAAYLAQLGVKLPIK